MAEKLTLKQRWEDMPKNSKIGLVVGVVFVLSVWVVLSINAYKTQKILEEQKAANRKPSQVMQGNVPGVALDDPTKFTASIPSSSRNQGLEVMQAQIEEDKALIKKMRVEKDETDSLVKQLSMKVDKLSSGTSSPGKNNPADPSTLNAPLPGVSFDQGSMPIPNENKVGAVTQAKSSSINVSEPSSVNAVKKAPDIPPITIPRNSIIESVMLSGINALVNVSTGQTAGGIGGSITPARQVGTPFITRVKGNALLPNGWKVAELGDCFISGTGVGVLSTEKANVIADSVSCVDSKGRIYEGKIKAFGVDEDGVSGIAGKLVTKQGTILMKTALAGIASGLGQALTPQPLQSFNANASGNGQTAYNVPSGSLIAGTALGTGISNSMSQLSKFYLDYARQMMPVIEINAGTRITWVLQEGVDLQATNLNTSTANNTPGFNQSYNAQR